MVSILAPKIGRFRLKKPGYKGHCFVGATFLSVMRCMIQSLLISNQKRRMGVLVGRNSFAFPMGNFSLLMGKDICPVSILIEDFRSVVLRNVVRITALSQYVWSFHMQKCLSQFPRPM